MDRFYVIKMVNTNNGKRGFVIKENDQIMISVDSVTARVSQFASIKEALVFIKKNKLEKNGCICYVVNNEELIRERPEGIQELKGSLFYIETADGRGRIFFNTIKNEYYFDVRDNGFAVWNDRESARQFIDSIDPRLQEVNRFQVREIKQE